MEKEVHKQKKELELKYESMKLLKEQVNHVKTSYMTEDMRLKLTEMKD